MTLVIDLPERSKGRIGHPLPDDDPEAVCRIIARLAPYVPRDGRWRVEGEQ